MNTKQSQAGNDSQCEVLTGPLPRPMQILNRFMNRYPLMAPIIDVFRREIAYCHGSPWPEWCFLPPDCFGMIAEQSLDETADTKKIVTTMNALGALGTWRMTKGIYQFEPSLLEELLANPMTGKMPANVFHRLPEWCVYVRTPGMDWFGEPLHGFWAHIVQVLEPRLENLVFMLDKETELESAGMDIGPWSIREGIIKSYALSEERAGLHDDPDWETLTLTPAKLAKALAPLVSIVMHLCSEKLSVSDTRTPGRRPANPRPQKTADGFRVIPSDYPTMWQVRHDKFDT